MYMFRNTSLDATQVAVDDFEELERGLAAVATLKRGQEEEQTRAKADTKSIVFAHSRIRAILACVENECVRCLNPERGRVLLDILLPYCVELNAVDPSKDVDWARDRVSWWLPGIYSLIGHDEFLAAWSEHSETRSIAAANQFANPKHRGKVLHWLPSAQQIAETFGLTREVRDAVNTRQLRHGGKPPIRGIPVIDPPSPDELRAKNRERMETKRRSEGVRAQSARTKTRDLEALAKRAGCSLSTLKRQRKHGTIVDFLAERGIDAEAIRSVSE